jgi:hypothetical protein
MIERLFFHWIDAKAAAAPIGGENKPVIDTLAHKTESALALMEFAQTRAELAFKAPIRQYRPPIGQVVGMNHWL